VKIPTATVAMMKSVEARQRSPSGGEGMAGFRMGMEGKGKRRRWRVMLDLALGGRRTFTTSYWVGCRLFL